MDHTCEECARLCREYADALMAHIRLRSKLEIAVLSHERSIVEELAPKVATAAQVRELARTALRTHEAAAHP